MSALARSSPSPFGGSRPAALAAVAVLAACGADQRERAPQALPPVVAALEVAGLPSLVRGRVLLGELGCVACHDAGSRAIDAAAGPDLRTVGTRVEARYLADFLGAPHQREPGTVMPDLLGRWRGAERGERSDALAHYLRSLSPSASADVPARAEAGDAAPDAADVAAAAARGETLYGRIGCRACHGDGAPPAYVRDKYSFASLQAFLLAPHDARPSRRMPDFGLSPGEAHDLARFLLGVHAAAAAPAAPPLDAAKVARGRALFGELRCIRCHPLGDAAPPPPEPAPAPPLDRLDPARGCLSGEVGPWPHYPLSDAQRAAIRAALAANGPPPAGEPRVLELLASRRCTACHRRGDVDAIAPRPADLFGTDDASLGEQGRLPPPLTGVGAKLQRGWLERAIAHGQRERPYLHASMPGFGEPFAGALAAALADVDTLPPIAIAPLPDDDEAAKPVLELGRALVGDQGMNCITCHRFAGEQAGVMGAIDLVHTTGERLRPEWFAHYLRDPYRFSPNTLMPHFFPDGRSTRQELGDGDAQRQIDALWHYLAAGRNGRRPNGLVQPPIELAAGDEAVLLRRSVQGAKKRGIAVGYPGGVNVTFDAENLGLNQIWWGRFVDARPVWTSQGSGQAQILSRDVVPLPNGPAFAALDAPDAAWPAATRRERGDRWLGYELDAERRPTFRYTAGDVLVEDRAQEVRDGSPPRLVRTLRLTGPAGRLWFRAARGADVRRVDERTVRLARGLVVRCEDVAATVVARDGEEPELRLEARVAPDGAELTLEYVRQEESR